MKPPVTPPKWAEAIIDRFAPDPLVEEIKGDLYEMFLEDRKLFGDRIARRNYCRRVIGFATKAFFWKRGNNPINHMSGSYLKMAKRSLSANKGITAINVLGLTIAIAAGLAIVCIIQFELSFDTFHSNYQNIYRVVRVSGVDRREFRTGIPYALPPAMSNLSSIKKMTKMEYFGGASVDILSADGKSEKQFIEDRGVVTVEPEFFNVMDFAHNPIEWLSGNPANSLKDPSSVVITSAIAKKYFGHEDPVGRTLRFQKVFDFKITGVVNDFPSNTDFPFNLMISYSSMPLIFKERMSDWVSVNDGHSAFVVLDEGADPKAVEQQLAHIHAAHVNKDLSTVRHYLLQPLSEVHFDPNFGTFSKRIITHETILALEFIVFCLLAAGCINYINLSTAQFTLRSKEVGIRKIMGSSQKSLIFQFLVETFVIVLLAALMALILVLLFMPTLVSMLGLPLEIMVTDFQVWRTLALIVLTVTICSGLYPSLSLSRFNPVSALKNKFSTERIAGVSLRKGLVIAQFTATQVLAVTTFIIIAQLDYFRTSDMGFDQDASIVSMRLINANPSSVTAFESELRRLPFVENVSKSFTLPSGVDRNRSTRDIGKPNARDVQDFQHYEYCAIDENFLDLYGIQLVAGRNLTPTDSAKNILVNETLLKNLGYEDPQDIVGTELKIGGEGMARVVGVVNDYFGNSLKERVNNIALDAHPGRYRQVSVRLQRGPDQKMSDILAELELTWKKIYPEHVFQYRFLHENIALFYQQETKYSKLFQLFLILFITIGCLGLYGLVTFVVNKKGKEIAVRKALGATVLDILAMFSREYVKLIAVSFALAVPIAWYGINEWLMNFEHHIEIKWWLFATPGVTILLLALAVVSLKSFGAAISNPVSRLKNE
ncbi:MAG TPA: ABC transporter permease [Chryseosolibacter sp.]